MQHSSIGQPCGGSGCQGKPPYCPDCEAEVEAMERERWASYYGTFSLMPALDT